MNSKNRKILRRIFENPLRPDIRWQDIENLMKACGAELSEGRGSRVRIYLNGVRAVFHRPHPGNFIDRGAVKSMRRFLINAGVIPDAV